MSDTTITERRRRVRLLTLQMLYQIDARNGEDLEEITHSLQDASCDPSEHFEGPWKVLAPADPEEHREAFQRAVATWECHEEADRLATELSPKWPTYRQPVMDRNVIRLCWYEMTRGDTPPKVAVNEAVELGKNFGTERSAPFLNGVLDKMLKRVLNPREEKGATQSAGSAVNDDANPSSNPIPNEDTVDDGDGRPNTIESDEANEPRHAT